MGRTGHASSGGVHGHLLKMGLMKGRQVRALEVVYQGLVMHVTLWTVVMSKSCKAERNQIPCKLILHAECMRMTRNKHQNTAVVTVEDETLAIQDTALMFKS